MLDTNSIWWKYITPVKLKELIEKLPEDANYITVSRVGNLVFLDKDLNGIGCINMSSEDIEMY